MPRKNLDGVAACAALAAAFLTVSTVMVAQGPSAPAAVAAPAPPPPSMPPSLPPSYVVNLMTPEGIAAFNTQWKNMDAKIVEVPAMPGAGAKWKTAYDIQPHAGESGFDDSSWPTIGAKALDERRGGGRVFFTWYARTHHSGLDRRLRHGGRQGGSHRGGRRLRGSLGQRANASPQRLPQPRDDPGLQHAESRGARRRRQGGRQVPGRDFRHQRADFGRAVEYGLVP